MYLKKKKTYKLQKLVFIWVLRAQKSRLYRKRFHRFHIIGSNNRYMYTEKSLELSIRWTDIIESVEQSKKKNVL